MKNIGLVYLFLLLFGCSVNPHVKPQIIGVEGAVFSETTVFVAADQKFNAPVLTTIIGVDGREVNCDWNYGCPLWVRVDPGSHVFSIEYASDPHFIAGMKFKRIIDVAVKNMIPRHVYVARYSRNFEENTISVNIEEFGENSNFKFKWPPVSSAAQYYPAEF